MTQPTPTRFQLVAGAIGVLGSLLGAGCAQPESAQTEHAPSTGAQSDNAPAAASLELPSDPKAALAALKTASTDRTVAVFKHSPICPISHGAQERFQGWMAEGDRKASVSHVQIDVLGQKPLARGLVAELGVKHESPQVLLFHDGELIWHASHDAITGEALSEQLESL